MTTEIKQVNLESLPPLPPTPPIMLSLVPKPKISRAEKIRVRLGLTSKISVSKILSTPMSELTDEEKVFKQEYTKEIRLLPNSKQHQKLQYLIDQDTFPLPVHPCKYCMCGEKVTMSKLTQTVVGCPSSSLVKVDEFRKYRWQAIYKHPEVYRIIDYDEFEDD
jgi:hypothetical protein